MNHPELPKTTKAVKNYKKNKRPTKNYQEQKFNTKNHQEQLRTNQEPPRIKMKY